MSRRKDSLKWYGPRLHRNPLFTVLANGGRRKRKPGYIPPAGSLDMSTCPEKHKQEGYRCTRAAGHDGIHVAHNTKGDMEASW